MACDRNGNAVLEYCIWPTGPSSVSVQPFPVVIYFIIIPSKALVLVAHLGHLQAFGWPMQLHASIHKLI